MLERNNKRRDSKLTPRAKLKKRDSLSKGEYIMKEDNYHIMPVNDWKEHVDNEDCWCRPSKSLKEDNVIIHNSLDGREVQELREEIGN